MGDSNPVETWAETIRSRTLQNQLDGVMDEHFAIYRTKLELSFGNGNMFAYCCIYQSWIIHILNEEKTKRKDCILQCPSMTYTWTNIDSVDPWYRTTQQHSSDLHGTPGPWYNHITSPNLNGYLISYQEHGHEVKIIFQTNILWQGSTEDWYFPESI